MKTPFYIIKRTPVNKKTAMEKWHKLFNGSGDLHNDASDLIDFCLSGGTEEKVFIEPGMRVRIKSMPAGAFEYTSPRVGAECEIAAVVIRRAGAGVDLNTDGDFNCLRIKEDNPDLSAYLEPV